jgi:hypothetical protein
MVLVMVLVVMTAGKLGGGVDKVKSEVEVGILTW